jgi:uncharacterized Zn finger protein
VSRSRWLEALGIRSDDVVDERNLREAERLRTAGRVMSVRTTAGLIEARVQGSHARPHLVELAVDTWTDEQWRAVGDLLARQARHYARLLAGQLPDQFDMALTELGLSLVPRAGQWRLRCTCDQASPCVHQVAVWLTVRDYLDREPYLITRLRGRSREQLLAEIRDQRAAGERAGVDATTLDTRRWSSAAMDPAEVPLPAVRRPATTAGPLRMLGDPPGWAGPADAVTMFGPAIVAAGDRARLLLSEDGPVRDR